MTPTTHMNEFHTILRMLLRQLRICPGKISRTSGGGVFLMVAPLDPLVDPNQYLVTLGWGVPPKPEVQNLACGLLVGDPPRLVAAHRTNRQGQFLFELPEEARCEEGKELPLHLHFVIDILETLDVDVLLQLGDEEALEQLDDCLRDDQISEEVKQYIRDRRNAPAVKVTLAQRVPFVLSREAADLCISAGSQDTASGESPFAWYIDEKESRLVVELPATHVDDVDSHVRFGAVLVEVRDADVIVARHLLPVARADNVCGNSAGLAEILGECPFSPDLKFSIFLDSKELLRRVSVNQVDRALQTRYVELRAELQAKLQTLREALSNANTRDEPKRPGEST